MENKLNTKLLTYNIKVRKNVSNRVRNMKCREVGIFGGGDLLKKGE